MPNITAKDEQEIHVYMCVRPYPVSQHVVGLDHGVAPAVLIKVLTKRPTLVHLGT